MESIPLGTCKMWSLVPGGLYIQVVFRGGLAAYKQCIYSFKITMDIKPAWTTVYWLLNQKLHTRSWCHVVSGLRSLWPWPWVWQYSRFKLYTEMCIKFANHTKFNAGDFNIAVLVAIFNIYLFIYTPGGAAETSSGTKTSEVGDKVGGRLSRAREGSRHNIIGSIKWQRYNRTLGRLGC